MAGPTSPWYETFFADDYLNVYGDVLASRSAESEAAFAERALELSPGDTVLDLCCGPGRHALLFAKRGMRVVGQDLNADYLETARRSAEEDGVSLELVRRDMRDIPFEETFDGIVNMFSAFGYLESEEEDMKVLDQVSRALKPGGGLLIDSINREWVVSNYIQNEWREGDDGTVYLEHRELDLATSRNHITFTIVSADGTRRESRGHHIRLYTLTEVKGMLERAGLDFKEAYGGFDGEEYTVATPRMIVVARKPG